MNREELPQEASREDKMRDALKHYEELATKACWHRSDIPDAIRAYYASPPPAEGAEQRIRVRNILQDFYRRGEYELEQAEEDIMRLFQPQPTAEGAEEISNAILAAAHDYDTKIRNHEEETADSDDYIAFVNGAQWMREFASQQHPPAEGAEEILEAHTSLIDPDSRVWYSKGQAIGMMQEFATLHAQRIADKMVEKMSPSNEQIHAAALAWARDHSEAPDKDCPDWLIRDYEAGAYFVRQCYGCWNKTDNLKSRE